MNRRWRLTRTATSVGRSARREPIFVAMLLAALSLWTALPLTWIYIGSKVSKTQFPAEAPYMVVIVGLIISIVLVAWLISRLNRLYVRDHRHQPPGADAPRLAAQHARHRRPGEQHDRGRGGADGLGPARRRRPHLWFFLLAGSPLPQQ